MSDEASVIERSTGTRDGVEHIDAVVVGAGFAGIYALYRLRRDGFRVRVFEAGDDVGGTWYWNRYPGARCDVDSLEYSYQFDEDLQREWEWTEKYAGQAEILRYINHVVDRFDLRSGIQCGTRVTSAVLDETSGRWHVRTDRGDEVSARFVVMASGCLSTANMPAVEGRDTFQGEMYHTGRWPHGGVDFSGKRVGVVGTGSSAIQAIPVIAQQAAELFVFQRTANYSIPARNRPLDPAEVAEIKADYPGFRARNSQRPAGFGSRNPISTALILETDPEEIEKEFRARWEAGGFGFLGAYVDVPVNPEANEVAAEFVRERIRETVQDPEVADLLSPKQVIGCKRLCLDTGYFETFNEPHVHLVDVSNTPVESITPTGLCTGGREYELDAIVFATGFDAMTGSLLAIDIRGRGGNTLRDRWVAGPITYLGLGVPGFPNLFIITGPGSPSVLTNMIVSIEQHVNWIADCMGYLRDNGKQLIEAEPAAADAWVEHVNTVAGYTLYPTCNSWYLGANVPGKPRVFMPLPGFPPYVEKCTEVAEKGYEGFALT